MENSMKPSYEQGKQGDDSLLAITAIGFSFFWLQFFAELMYGGTLGTTFGQGGPIPVTPAAVCLGFAIANMVVSLKCDFFSGERGQVILMLLTIAGPVVSALLLLLSIYLGMAFPLWLVLLAWLVAGLGLGSSLALWAEMLSGYTKEFASKATAIGAGTGGLLFFVLTNLDHTLAIASIFVAGLLSVFFLRMLGKNAPATEYVSRKECLQRHKLTFPIDVLNSIYGVIFGIGIFGLTNLPEEPWMYFAVALAIIACAFIMTPIFKRNTDKMMHGKIQRAIFPFIVVSLILAPFVHGILEFALLLLLVGCFTILTLVNLDSLFCLEKHFDVSSFYLTGRGYSPILIGLALGYAVASIIVSSGATIDEFMMVAGIVMIIILSFAISFIDFDIDYLEVERVKANAPEQTAADGSSGEAYVHFEQRCDSIAESHGLSSREKEVFCLLARGRGTTFIQNKLFISQHTVKSHAYHIYKKLGINSREELLSMVEDYDDDRR